MSPHAESAKSMQSVNGKAVSTCNLMEKNKPKQNQQVKHSQSCGNRKTKTIT
jgi:hypothetical protein